MTYIYLVENCYNDPNKVYIGKTKNSRKGPHKRKYGKNITYTIIDQINSLNHKKWKPLESYWIEQFRQWGFELMNINKKGGQGPGVYSEESKNKMRKPRKEGTGLKISKVLKQNNHSQYYTEEVKQRISEGNKVLKPFSDEHKQNMLIAKRKQAKPLLMFDLNDNLVREWESKGQAAEWIKETTGKTSNITTQIKDCCLGKQKTAFKFKWKYK